jgi:hypothetical protein
VDRAGENGRNGAVPWASVFDPAANVRALTAIQHEGFRAASDLVDRFIRIAAAGIAPPDSQTTTEQPQEDARAAMFGAIDMEPVIRSWWSMMGQFTGAPAAGGTDHGHDATLDFAQVVADGQLRLETEPSGSATAEIWLLNHGRDDRGDVVLRCGELLSDRGAVIDSSAVIIEPSVLPMPGRSSRGVDVSVAVGAEVVPGVYRGTVVAQGFPDLWLPIAVTVRSATP